jgi:hypothetical protein
VYFTLRVVFSQAAKVLSAHAASIGDALLGVPLHCAAGLYTEAAALLQVTDNWDSAVELISIYSAL